MKRNRSHKKKVVDSQTSSSSCPAKSQPSELLYKCCTLQDAGLGLLNVKSCVSPTRPDRTTARTERLFSRIIVTRPDQCPEAGGTEMFVRLANVPNVAHICL